MAAAGVFAANDPLAREAFGVLSASLAAVVSAFAFSARFIAAAGAIPLASRLLNTAWDFGEDATGELNAKEPLASDADGVLSARAAVTLAVVAFSAFFTASAGGTPLAIKLLKAFSKTADFPAKAFEPEEPLASALAETALSVGDVLLETAIEDFEARAGAAGGLLIGEEVTAVLTATLFISAGEVETTAAEVVVDGGVALATVV